MRIETTRFGTVELTDDQRWTFPEGLLGFGGIHEYAIVPHPGSAEFEWLQAVNEPELAFAMTNPLLFVPDYRVLVRPPEMASIELEELEQGIVKVIVVVRKSPMRITANLQGPLVFNPASRLAKQMVLTDGDYTTRHLLFEEGPAKKAGNS